MDAKYWSFNEDALQLELNYKDDNGHIHEYQVSLRDCCNSAQILDWIAQVADKTWASNELIGELVRYLDYLLHLQASVCGGGKGSQIIPEDAIKTEKMLKEFFKFK